MLFCEDCVVANGGCGGDVLEEVAAGGVGDDVGGRGMDG